MDLKVFTARKDMLDLTLHGKNCMEALDATYGSNELAAEFDPISREIPKREMCQEFVKEIDTLLDMSKSSLLNATRYSYLISQQVDLETEQIDTFAGCIEYQAKTDPRSTCIEMMTEPGHFDLYSNQDKAEICQTAIYGWDEEVKYAELHEEKMPDACASITTHIFQAYSWFL